MKSVIDAINNLRDVKENHISHLIMKAEDRGDDVQITYLEKMNEVLDTAIFALEKQLNNEWISVEDRLPEENKLVNVYVKSNKTVFVGCTECNGKWYVLGFKLGNNEDVTHWQPLPSVEGLK